MRVVAFSCGFGRSLVENAIDTDSLFASCRHSRCVINGVRSLSLMLSLHLGFRVKRGDQLDIRSS